MKQKIYLFIFLHTCILQGVKAQTIFVNTATSLYTVNIVNGCAVTNAFASCASTNYYSIAVYKDSLYYNTSSGALWRVKLDGTGCQQLATSGMGGNSLTVDNNGVVYSVISTSLVKYDPSTNIVSTIGSLPFSSAGDLMFYNGKLLLASIPSGIYEINISNPSASVLYMNTNGRQFWGLAAMPNACGTIGYYALEPAGGSTNIVELDLLNKVIIANTCAVNLGVYDAASTAEGGNNYNLQFDSITITNPCVPLTVGSIKATSNLTYAVYTINGQNPNNTGLFTNVPIGTHTIQVTTPNGLCFKDSVITLVQKPKSMFALNIQRPTCNTANGSISVTPDATIIAPQYAINNGALQGQNSFANLSSGSYTISVVGSNTCRVDSVVMLTAANVAPITKSIQTTMPTCALPLSGGINLTITGLQTPYRITYNGTSYTNAVALTTLPQGIYNFVVYNNAQCIVDSFSIALTVTQTPECANVFIPTAFTPNNDGRNDMFQPTIGISNTNIEFTIYNRFGQLLYQNNTNFPVWNGYYKGNIQPLGTYIYKLLFTNAMGKKQLLKGTLQLIY